MLGSGTVGVTIVLREREGSRSGEAEARDKCCGFHKESPCAGGTSGLGADGTPGLDAGRDR